MIGLVRNEWKKVFLPVLLTTVLLAIAMSVLSCTIYQNYVLHYDLEASACYYGVSLFLHFIQQCFHVVMSASFLSLISDLERTNFFCTASYAIYFYGMMSRRNNVAY